MYIIPKKMGEAVGKYALAVAKVKAAERDLAKIMAEKLERDIRISQLQDMKEALDENEIDAWCCTYSDQIAVGTEVATMEVPGDYREDGAARESIMRKGTPQAYTVSWIERSINIAPNGSGGAPHGKLRPVETLDPALVAYNVMLAPGHLKWRPRWRYGVIQAMNGSVCDVLLTPVDAAPFDGETKPLGLDFSGGEALANVQIRYASCGYWAFEVGDEVLLSFGGNRDTPVVIGFRREPRNCRDRIGWIQMGF